MPTPDGAVAWQECGSPDRPPLLMLPPLAQHGEMAWDKPAFWRPLLNLASRHRLVMFDKLGTGLSDPLDRPAGLAGRVDQARAVLDAAGIETSAVFGFSDGGATALGLAARHPDRVSALVLTNTPINVPAAALERHGSVPAPERAAAFWSEFVARWGTADTLTIPYFAPSLAADRDMRSWVPRYERAAASPRLIGRWVEEALSLDTGELPSSVRCPTLVIHARGDRVVPVAHGRFLADRIEGARYLELDARDHFQWMSPDVDDFTAAVHGFLGELGLAAERAGGARQVRRLWDPFDALTPGERRCVRLAQRGMANAAIAETLELSVRTVENHLARAYPKLGVANRVELVLLGEGAEPLAR